MSAVEFWKTFFEFVSIVLLIIGFINEKRVVAFEKRLATAIRAYVRARKTAQNKHLDDPEKVSQEFAEQFPEPRVVILDTWKNKKYKEG